MRHTVTLKQVFNKVTMPLRDKAEWILIGMRSNVIMNLG